LNSAISLLDLERRFSYLKHFKIQYLVKTTIFATTRLLANRKSSVIIELKTFSRSHAGSYIR